MIMPYPLGDPKRDPNLEKNRLAESRRRFVAHVVERGDKDPSGQ